MQNILINLPDKESIFSFVCRGLIDIPGVEKAVYVKGVYHHNDDNILCIPLGKEDKIEGNLQLLISDFNAFAEYEQYVRNFMFMVEVILEEQYQRKQIDLHQGELENSVKQRTRQLLDEINERKTIEESLKESLALLRIAGEKAKLGGWIVNLKESVVHWSDETAAIHEMPAGYHPTIEQGLSYYAPEWHEKIREVFNLCVTRGIAFDEEMEIFTAQGKRLWVRTIGEALRDADGEIVKVKGAFQDITERIQSEQKRRESEENYRNFIETMQDGVYRMSKGKFTEVNNALVNMLGYESKEALLGIDIETQFFFPNHHLMIIRKKREESGMTTFQVRKKDGFPIWLQDHGRDEYDENGLILYREGTFRDITEQTKTEEAMRQVEIARESERLKQNFLANMSHEIRTPLTGVLGMIEILERTKLTKKQQEFISTIKLSGENLNEIINQVLDYSKIEAGKATLKPVVFMPGAIMNDAEKLYQNIVKNSVKLKVYLDPDIPQYIFADRNRIMQVLNNLVYNALKFTLKGSVLINSKLVFFDIENKLLNIKIEVKDTGIGIRAHQQKFLFEPFSQVEHNDTRDYEGTGLGLAICKELVKMLGGEIGVESEIGKGSTFWFTFLAGVADTPAKHIIKGDNIQQDNKLHILFADDKQINQKVVSLMLNSLGHTVSVVNQGLEALHLYEPGKYDLILMDIQMPVMDGITATKELKARYKNLPPIVGLSANAFEGDREKYMQQGMDEYLTKPIKIDDFHRLMIKLFPDAI